MRNSIYPNKSDWDEKFWSKNYRVLVTAQGFEFFVNANNEVDAIDFIIDYCVDYMPGLLWSDDEVFSLEEEGRLHEYIQGGNSGNYLNTYNIKFEEIK